MVLVPVAVSAVSLAVSPALLRSLQLVDVVLQLVLVALRAIAALAFERLHGQGELPRHFFVAAVAAETLHGFVAALHPPPALVALRDRQ